MVIVPGSGVTVNEVLTTSEATSTLFTPLTPAIVKFRFTCVPTGATRYAKSHVGSTVLVIEKVPVSEFPKSPPCAFVSLGGFDTDAY